MHAECEEEDPGREPGTGRSRSLLWGLTGAFVLNALAVLHFLGLTASGVGASPVHTGSPGAAPLLLRLGRFLLNGLLWPIHFLADWLPGLNEPGMAYAYIGMLGFLYGSTLFAFRHMLRRHMFDTGPDRV